MHMMAVDGTRKKDRAKVLAAASIAWILCGAWAHGQEEKVGVQLPHADVGARNAQQIYRGASGPDPATLPPIESIDARTDITVFLQSGVPDELRLAALRRAWTVDPAIRDHKPLQENDWNFNDLNSIPGFGELGPEVDSKRMAAEILGEAPRLVLAR